MSEPDPPSERSIVIAVVRTGGVAGIRRRWQAEPHDDEAPHWIELIERCPWDAPGEQAPGADRYVWRIRARTPRDEHERELSDSELSGAWRDLVDAVRDRSSRSEGGREAESLDDGPAG